MTTGLRSPFVYYGGKSKLAERIAARLPDHSHYVEPFAGSLSVLLAKSPARMETVNDLDGDLMLFWRVLRDQPEALARACALTPHSRAERDQARHRPADLPEVERARRVWVCLTQGRTGTLRNTGWRFDTADHANISMPDRLAGYVAWLEAVAARLASVSLECRPALDVIAAYGGQRRTLLYVDPPYLAEARNGHNYRHEMNTDTEHRALAEALHAGTATVVLSGYASDLYDRDLYADWYRYEFPASTSQGGTWQQRTEILWSNRPLRATENNDRAENLFDLAEFRNTSTENESGCNETQCPAPDCGRVIRQPATGRRDQAASTPPNGQGVPGVHRTSDIRVVDCGHRQFPVAGIGCRGALVLRRANRARQAACPPGNRVWRSISTLDFETAVDVRSRHLSMSELVCTDGRSPLHGRSLWCRRW